MSRRKRPDATRAPGGAGRAAARGEAASHGPAAGRRTWRGIAADGAILIAVFAITAAIAGLAGAANLGVALGVGQVAFAIALVVVLLRA
jgi:hypothetical protein